MKNTLIDREHDSDGEFLIEDGARSSMGPHTLAFERELTDKSLSYGAIVFFLWLNLTSLDDPPAVIPPPSELSKKFGCSVESVDEWLSQLRLGGYIS